MKRRSKFASLFLTICLITTTIFVPAGFSYAAGEVEVSGGLSTSTAPTIQTGTEYVTTITAKGVEHYYKFTTPNTAGYYYLQSKNIGVPSHTVHSYANLYATICTAYKEKITENRHVRPDYGSGWHYTECQLDPGTTYYVRIIGNQGNENGYAYGSDAYFKFKLIHKADDYKNTSNEASKIELNKTYNAAIQGIGDEDWFMFTTGNSTRYELYGNVIGTRTHSWSNDLYFRYTLMDKYKETKDVLSIKNSDLSKSVANTHTVYLDPNTTYYIQARNPHNGDGIVNRLNDSGKYQVAIGKPVITKDHITFDIPSYTYNGKAKKPEVTVVYNGETLTKNKDYKVTYSNNVNAGTAKVTVTGIGNFIGSVSKSFTISRAQVSSKSKVTTLSKTSYTYNGSAKKPTVEIEGLEKGKDFTVEYKSNVNAGTAKAVITGIGNYKGTLTKTFTIKPISIKGKTASLSTKTYYYDGTSHKPTVTIKGLKKGKDFTVTYSKSKNPGKATATVKGINNYKDTKKLTYTIKIKNTKIKSLSSGNNKFTVKWSTVSSKYVSGYQIRYSEYKSMKNSKKTDYIKRSTSSKVVKGLDEDKYYVQIRTYKVINGEKEFSSWSTAKSVTTK